MFYAEDAVPSSPRRPVSAPRGVVAQPRGAPQAAGTVINELWLLEPWKTRGARAIGAGAPRIGLPRGICWESHDAAGREPRRPGTAAGRSAGVSGGQPVASVPCCHPLRDKPQPHVSPGAHRGSNLQLCCVGSLVHGVRLGLTPQCHGAHPIPCASPCHPWAATSPRSLGVVWDRSLAPFPALTHFLVLLPLPGAAALGHCPAGSSQVLVSLAALFRLQGAGWDRGAALCAGWEPPGSPCSISRHPALLLGHAFPPQFLLEADKAEEGDKMMTDPHSRARSPRAEVGGDCGVGSAQPHTSRRESLPASHCSPRSSFPFCQGNPGLICLVFGG